MDIEITILFYSFQMSYEEFLKEANPLFDDGDYIKLFGVCESWLHKLDISSKNISNILLIPYTYFVPVDVYKLTSNPIIEYIVIRMLDMFEEGIFMEKIIEWIVELKRINYEHIEDECFRGYNFIKKYKLEKIYEKHPNNETEISNCFIKGKMFKLYYEDHKNEYDKFEVGSEYIFRIGSRKYSRILMKNDNNEYYIERVGRGKHILTIKELNTSLKL